MSITHESLRILCTVKYCFQDGPIYEYVFLNWTDADFHESFLKRTFLCSKENNKYVVQCLINAFVRVFFNFLQYSSQNAFVLRGSNISGLPLYLTVKINLNSPGEFSCTQYGTSDSVTFPSYHSQKLCCNISLESEMGFQNPLRHSNRAVFYSDCPNGSKNCIWGNICPFCFPFVRSWHNYVS
jgi:hypothetical protein